ncbi:zinc-ribbon domain-containing protein [Collinsella tanakaei]|uniref:zinc-ribbon domain-containing protein n=1 Tax=Collinsella tanakaei TaxID=626935 RepID=UPI0025A49F17|nr:zinc-ribbon domain-containing protein [Collinsella tanakaei]MDM8300157.1 leucine-rich repeat domain-containing protein [Collinsella tanakaei]
MKCTNCGNTIPDNARFCSHCGAAVAAEPQAPGSANPEQSSSGETREQPAHPGRRRTALIAVAVVALIAALGCGAWFLLPRVLGPKVVLNLQDVPDEAFRTYLAQKVDTDGNSGIDQEEADAVTAIGDTSADAVAGNGLAGLGITNLEGISTFSNLTQLVCADNQLTELDLSGLANLTDLNCSSNQLGSLDVSDQADLTDLDCSNNQLTDLDLTSNDALASVSCDDNKDLSSLTLPKGDALSSVHATGCALESIDLAGLSGLADIQLDDAVQISGDAATVDDQARDNLELLATLYTYCVEPEPWQQTISTVRAQAGDADVDAQLVWISLTLSDAFVLTHGETNQNASGDPLGVATSHELGMSYTLTDDGVRTILATYYGSAPDDLSYLHNASNALMYDASTGTWTAAVGTAPVGETVWTGNFTSYGTYLAYDLAMLILPGTDAPRLCYYHVVAQQSEASALGYRMVSLSAADDLSASFPDAAAAYDELMSTPVSLSGEWDMQGTTRNVLFHTDGTCWVNMQKGSWTSPDSRTVIVLEPERITFTYDPITTDMVDQDGNVWSYYSYKG